MSGLVLLAATWKCLISYKNEYLGLFVLHLQLLWNLWAIVEMQLAYVFPVGITSVDARLNWLNWFHFLIFVEDLLVILRLHDFSVTIPICYKNFYVNSFFPCTIRHWNSLPIECFLLSYDLSGFKSVQPCTLELTDQFICRFFLNRFPVCFNHYVLGFLVTICLAVAVQPCME